MNGVPYFCCSPLASMRPNMSVVPPAVNGTTIVTWRAGQSCAGAGAARASVTRAKAETKMRTERSRNRNDASDGRWPPRIKGAPSICKWCQRVERKHNDADLRQRARAMSLSETIRGKLATVSTATLTTVLFKRGFRNTFIQGIHRLNPGGAQMVGPAYTMRYIPAREDLDHLGVFEDRSHPQRKGIEECPAGHVFVIDSRRNPSAASAGGILVTRLWKRAAAGIATDGGFRDSPEIAKLPFPAYHAAPAAPTNLIKHHAVDLNVPIACGEVPVYPGDVLVGDDEGVAVIPQHLVDAVAEEAFEQTAFEDFVQEQVAAGRSIFGIYPPAPEAREEFKRWRAAKGR